MLNVATMLPPGKKKRIPDISETLYYKEAVRTGLEPATPCVTGRYSNQLNYRTSFFSLQSHSIAADAKVIFLTKFT